MPVRRTIEAAAWALSLAAHLLVGAYIYWGTTAPDLGFDFALPDEVEFGLTDAVTVSAGASAPSEPEPTPEAAATEGEGPEAALDAGVPMPDAGPPDAGPRRRRRDAGPPEGEGEADEGEAEGDEEGEGHGVAFLPSGSQIALRLDVARVRRSPLADDVRQLLAALPDWQALLGGSDIDPLEDLDRVLIATPNLRRSRLIVAGRATGGVDEIRAAAAALATAAGETISWREQHGVQIARWYNRDETERVIALIGPRHFLICRPVDVPRVLAVALNRADDQADGAPAMHPADALLSMQEDEALSLEVEGARNFARARGRSRSPLEMMPTELRVSLRELPGSQVAVRSSWTFEGEDEASAAASYWDRMRVAYGRNIITAMLGLQGVLQRATVEAEGEHIAGDVDMQVTEMRQLLTLSRGFFQDRARAREQAAAPAPDSTAPGPTTPAPPAAPQPPPDNPYQ